MGRYIMELTLYHVLKIMVCWCTQVPWGIWQARISVRPFSLVVDFDAAIWSWKPKWTKRVSGQRWPNHGTRVEWEYKSSISWTYLCSGGFKRQAFFPFCARVRICFQRLAAWVSPMFSAARDVIWTERGNSTIIGGNASARATANSRRHRVAHVETQIVPWFPQSRTIRVVDSVLNDTHRRYENVLFWGNKDFRIRWMKECHNGEHVIHVTLWWRHGKQHRSDSRLFRCRWRSSREVSDPVWINSGSTSISPVDMQILDTLMARWYKTWFSK